MPPPPPLSARQRQQRRRQRALTTALVALTRVLERVDEQLLPATYFGVSCSLGASPSQLGAVTFSRLLVQALASPLGGVLGTRYHRGRVCGGACLAWALCCLAFSGVRSMGAAAAVWAINGVGLAILVPNAQGLVADLYPARQRGRAFGALLGVGHAGSMLATLFATIVGRSRFFGGRMAGWRLAFVVVAAFSAGVGALTAALAHDPRDEGWGEPEAEKLEEGEGNDGAAAAGAATAGEDARALLATPSAWAAVPQQSAPRRDRQHAGAKVDAPLRRTTTKKQHQSCASLLSDARRVCAVPSFLVIVTQGALGSTPWSALAFLTLYLQLRGWPDAAAAGVLASFSLASAVGSVLGGFVGDAASVPFPDHGRVAACQFSVLTGVPLAAVLFRGLPTAFSGRAVALTAAVLVSKGVLTQWAATACNNPCFAEVVPPRLRTAVFALDRCAEGVLSALGAPLVGRAAEALFGFGAGESGGGGGTAAAGDCAGVLAGGRAGGGGGSAGGGGAFARHAADPSRADALASAMLLFTTVPWALCALVYTLLHWTYPRDRRRAAAEAAAEVAAQAGAEGERARRRGGADGGEDDDGAAADEREEEQRADDVLGGGSDGVEVEMGRLLPPLPHLPLAHPASALPASWGRRDDW